MVQNKTSGAIFKSDNNGRLYGEISSENLASEDRVGNVNGLFFTKNVTQF